jgi:hypothetical protein
MPALYYSSNVDGDGGDDVDWPGGLNLTDGIDMKDVSAIISMGNAEEERVSAGNMKTLRKAICRGSCRLVRLQSTH